MASLRKILNWGLAPLGYHIVRPDRLDWANINRYRLKLATEIGKETGFQVQGGPFAGMLLHTEGTWSAADLTSKLLGFYEQELHSAIEAEIAKQPALVINVGAADGYYAIGLKRQLPSARVIAYEMDSRAHDDCRRLQELNSVSVEIRGKMEIEELADLAGSAKSSFIIMDCEGCEIELARIMGKSGIDNSSLLIECHDMFIENVTEMLVKKLSSTHDVHIIEETGRNPEKSKFLRGRNSFDKMLMYCEFRGSSMHWLYAVPK